MGAKLVPEHSLRRLFPVILTAVPMAFVFSDHSFGVRVKVFSPALFLKASNSVLLKFGLCRIYISIILSFQLAALCAPCVVGARDGAKQQAFKHSNSPHCVRPA